MRPAGKKNVTGLFIQIHAKDFFPTPLDLRHNWTEIREQASIVMSCIILPSWQPQQALRVLHG